MADQSTIQPNPARRHYCTACGDDMGLWDKFSRHGDTCGKFQCERDAREQDREDRSDSHERLDRDMGWM